MNRSPILHGDNMVDATGIWDESYRSYPGRSHGRADVFFGSTDNSCREKSAEVSVSRTKQSTALVLFK